MKYPPTNSDPASKPPVIEETDIDEADTLCGIGSWRPKWLQWFANPKAYLINICIQGVLQGAYFTYLIGVLSTIEKRYAFDSKISGIILISDNLSPVVIGILIGYYGGSVHRPRMIAWGMLIAALGCILMVIPYLIYGPALHFLSDSSALYQKPQSELCEAHKQELCEQKGSSGTLVAVSLIFIANFLNGVGSTAFYIIGTPYLDDNVKKKSSPMYFSFMFAIRLFGPSFGFVLASLCLQFYEDPAYDPKLSRTDPRFVGAWWLGFLILAVAIVLATLPMFLFPRYMKKDLENKQKKKKEDNLKDSVPKIKDLPKGLKRLAKNPILVCHTLGFICRLNGILGYYIFQPKYLETQFRQSASGASFFTGSTSVATMLLGIILGGFIIQKWKPKPRYLTAYMVLIEMVFVGCLVGVMFISCPRVSMPGTLLANDQLLLENECNSHCTCTTRVFQPVCGPDGVSSYFSPCFAGCNETSQSSSKEFTNCRCLLVSGNEKNTTTTTSFGTTISGFCDTNCQTFLTYVLILSAAKMIASTGRVGNALITLRCVDPEDKSLALGAMNVLLSVFAFIPYPLIFGTLTDAACIVWERKCGRTGNCWLYDVDKLRLYLHGASVIFLILGMVFDFIVFLKANQITKMYDDDDDDDNTADKEKKQPPHESNGDTIKEMKCKSPSKSADMEEATSNTTTTHF